MSSKYPKEDVENLYKNYTGQKRIYGLAIMDLTMFAEQLGQSEDPLQKSKAAELLEKLADIKNILEENCL